MPFAEESEFSRHPVEFTNYINEVMRNNDKEMRAESDDVVNKAIRK